MCVLEMGEEDLTIFKSMFRKNHMISLEKDIPEKIYEDGGGKKSSRDLFDKLMTSNLL